MYQRQPTMAEGLSQQQLLHLMMLADRFLVPKVMQAATAAFAAVTAGPAAQLDWNVAMQILELPSALADQQAFKAVQQLAADRVQQQLGDLEAVWAQQQLAEMLLGLPFNGLLRLLQHPETRVGSENTVVYTIQRWYHEQCKPGNEEPSTEQLQQLMRQVRMRHCTKYFAGTVMAQDSLVRRCFEPSEIVLLWEVCSSGGYGKLRRAGCPVLQKYPAWGEAHRPPSLRSAVVSWTLPLAAIEGAVQRLLSGGDVNVSEIDDSSSSTHIICGQPMTLGAQLKDYSNTEPAVHSSSTSSKRHLSLDLFLQLQDLPPNAERVVAADFRLKALSGATGQQLAPAGPADAGAAAAYDAAYDAALHQADVAMAEAPVDRFNLNHQAELAVRWPYRPADYGVRELPGVRMSSGTAAVSAQQNKLWCKGIVDLGWVSSWEDAEAVLQQKSLVHEGAAAASSAAAGAAGGDGGGGGECAVGVQGSCLHVRVKVTQLE
jgi:hypothetical protein